ncbi:unnamed protein product [Calypogeia fissa]
MRPCFKAKPGGLYSGGSAAMVEKALGVKGDEIMYMGDHMYTDVNQSKVHLRWRTTLICRVLEREVLALASGYEDRKKLLQLTNQMEMVADMFNHLQLAHQRSKAQYPPQQFSLSTIGGVDLPDCMQKLLVLMRKLDQKIAPMLEADGHHFNPRWGYLSRAGLWDKSHLTTQIEK